MQEDVKRNVWAILLAHLEASDHVPCYVVMDGEKRLYSAGRWWDTSFGQFLFNIETLTPDDLYPKQD